MILKCAKKHVNETCSFRVPDERRNHGSKVGKNVSGNPGKS
ncbi:hypothetical protein B4100_0494 [Heyndrickxia coagulans]|nr:hypothetical protein B4100_0494 [Heyndrickxia coagulans]